MRTLCRLSALVVAVLVAVLVAVPARGQSQGDRLFGRDCATCHAEPTGAVPSIADLQALEPEAIVTALTSGRMRTQGEQLSDAERRAIAEFLTGRAVATPDAVAGRCTAGGAWTPASGGSQWNGWGVDLRNTRFQPAAAAGLAARDVPRLTLKWAFRFPGALAARTQPAVVGGRLFTGSESGDVYALDAASGCIHWTFKAPAAVRTAMTVAAARSADGSSRLAVYLGDGRADAHALDAATGQPLWLRRVDDHPNASITGAPVVHDGRVYVVVSAAGEEVRGGRLDYGCCTFRGSVSALDAATGAVVWKTYAITETPRPRAVNRNGVQLFGPAGAGIWGAPTIDVKRGVLYVGTGHGFAEPAQPTTNAVLAIELATGRIRWVKQTVPNDVWIWQCPPTSPDNPNCPSTNGPDFDFGTAPILAVTPQGRELLVATQKSGTVYALDPDAAGAIVWQYRIGEGSALGGQWGAAADATTVYVGSMAGNPGGMHAIDLATGQRRWQVPPQPALCAGGEAQRCFTGQGAAISAIPGIAFSSGSDGGLRAYAAADGAIVWRVDTNREFQTVNGVKANGATMDGGGAVVAGGLLFVNSGYNGIVGRAGNVLLAFEVQ